MTFEDFFFLRRYRSQVYATRVPTEGIYCCNYTVLYAKLMLQCKLLTTACQRTLAAPASTASAGFLFRQRGLTGDTRRFQNVLALTVTLSTHLCVANAVFK